eukprot:5985482-Prorocentrum_lima.AAC.1
MVVLWEEHGLTSKGPAKTDALSVAVTSTLPRTAPDQSLIPQELHLQVQSRTDGNPIQENKKKKASRTRSRIEA